MRVQIPKKMFGIVFVIVFAVLAIALFGKEATKEQVEGTKSEVAAIIKVKAGYKPQEVTLPAGKASILRFETDSTYDCSASLYINELNIEKFLPPDGFTDIEIPAQPKGKEVLAGCAMGMYSFKMKFQ
ncbi:hypothetical protein CO112_03950 [Candidatus Dojkabacteria bacterium CG_4_9_14_3_um_filter_150_Dojkabacteria_WS6_41_13]|uniref:EfeO-type cupredoxin-like domain-containing protein n=1 Tax=Candidatus Dojkabacteria bacterium CG_4_10_14_0_2_um_filter_Dojkabacteria_WS6_41_15 TaxID=2014249 RepID=A0A2M7W127_9BACT|nr:MAG: hypothetical protein COZ14_04105 [Candidatus Dojkabacteria bacterium CG_4_10_14_3_um_filter_Dojkabacteria_WS6_41_9]PJA12856.1 MAG: hypothetical protein COX64_03985 [Candidatus Dojkabacteria bacterium CG_4_10_14_0_2_um_filter_Dojkabacteria_WS6_41_15]PJB22519.1 MAG: hypothetical protein CO112_03950 [Candidatus Dojkabacteria bacterium CG_4_9_14_3_um_filter_150_Dojkabacteria_WS6_41_13]